MSKNYTESYYLEAPDISSLIENYHQAYLQKYPNHFLSQQDPRFWLNESGELIFYAGEQALLDSDAEGVIQPLGRGLYDATLTITARFLELDLLKLPSKNIHIISLINFDRGHWTSIVLSLKNINQLKYQEIYKQYQDFKQYLCDKHPDFIISHQQSCTNLFVQYATGNRHGAIIKDRGETENLIRAFFKSIDKEVLLEIKTKPGEERYLEGNLELVLASKNQNNIGLFHFDSIYSSNTNQRVEQACSRFLEANGVGFAWAKNLQKQTGSTCGEHAILNALRYVFFRLTNVVPSKDLRMATNYFCPELAKLFLFDYKQGAYKYNYARILNEQKLKEQAQTTKKLTDQPALDAPTDQKEKINKIDRGGLLEFGIYIGIGITLVSAQVLGPMFFGIVNPLYLGVFSVAVGLAVAKAVKAFVPESEIEESIADVKAGNIFTQKNDKVDEQDLLEKLSKQAFEQEYPSVLPEQSKTFRPSSLVASSKEKELASSHVGKTKPGNRR